MQTVLLMQKIAADVKKTGVQLKAQFLGFNDVPTDNIFLGEYQAVKKFYPIPSYRGPLDGVRIDKRKSPEACAAFNRTAAECQALVDGKLFKVEVDEQPVIIADTTKHRPPAHSLWDYDVPAKFKAQDFRK